VALLRWAGSGAEQLLFPLPGVLTVLLLSGLWVRGSKQPTGCILVLLVLKPVVATVI